MDEQRLLALQEEFVRALELCQRQEWAEAESVLRMIAAEIPDGDLVQYNLGLALYGQEKFDQAGEAFLRAAAINKADPDYWYNSGLALKRAGRFSKALDAYQRALALSPDDPDLLYNIGCCLQAAGRIAEAAASYDQVLSLEPEHDSALANLAYCCHRRGDLAAAADLYRRLLVLRPDHTQARYLLDGLEGKNSDGPPPGYVSQLFDEYAAHFDHDLVHRLGYRVPSLLADMLTVRIGPGQGELVIVDLGCGTGLSGEIIRPWAGHLTGVDLSANMVAEAQKKGCYDRLVVEDVVSFLQQWPGPPIDLLVAADVLAYMGNLEPLFNAASPCVSSGGLFCFSIEREEGRDWQQRPSGRYGHDHAYLDRLAREHGWEILDSRTAEIRREGDRWLKGGLYLLQRSA